MVDNPYESPTIPGDPRRRKRWFSLGEIIVLFIIIVLLVSLLLPAMQSRPRPKQKNAAVDRLWVRERGVCSKRRWDG